MQTVWPRRNLVKFATLLLPIQVTGFIPDILAAAAPGPGDSRTLEPVSDLFPTQSPELAREMVTVAHFDLRRVKELVEARPSLARAAWDWGFGDWETALGAASHMGNRPIAEYLIQKGARPSLFSAAMLGQLQVVKAFVAAQAGVQHIRGPHSISLIAHARAGGEPGRLVVEFLQSIGGADADPAVALSERDAQRLPGAYIFGPATNQQIEVTIDHGQVAWARKGMMGRQLFHLGDRVFYPGGAEAVRIRFQEDGNTMTMTVEDSVLVLVARRKLLAN